MTTPLLTLSPHPASPQDQSPPFASPFASPQDQSLPSASPLLTAGPVRPFRRHPRLRRRRRAGQGGRLKTAWGGGSTGALREKGGGQCPASLRKPAKVVAKKVTIYAARVLRWSRRWSRCSGRFDQHRRGCRLNTARGAPPERGGGTSPERRGGDGGQVGRLHPATRVCEDIAVVACMATTRHTQRGPQ